ncbi:MAG: zinc ribbon domain-containing protein [bacterium]|nr:zinc ribbon domain-containing protein [bacterium]
MNCGKENEDTAQACVACGKSLVNQELPAQNTHQVYNGQAQQQSNVGVTPPGGSQNISNELPPELKKFNWGAFFFSWIWGIGNGVWIALLVFLFQSIPAFGSLVGIITGSFSEQAGAVITSIITFVGVIGQIGFLIWLGINGNRLAWKTGRWADIEKFKATQKKWAIAGLVFVGGFIIIPILMLIVIGATGGAKDKADDAKRSADLSRIQYSLEDCYDPSTESYPVDLNDRCITSKFDNGVVPKDPATGFEYEYKVVGTPPKSYALTAKMKSAGIGVENGLLILKNRQ